MALWSGIGINYGFYTTYDTSQVESDFTFLKSAGVTRLRIATPNFDGGNNTVPNCEDMVLRGLNHGFYVTWGVSCGFGAGTTTATRWASFKSYVTGTLAPWAQSNGLSELALGNEEEGQTDGTTITDATVRSDIRTLAGTVKTGGYTGKVSAQVQDSKIATWNSEGLGSNLDYIGFHCYDTVANFTTNVQAVATAFGAKGQITEFDSPGNGFQGGVGGATDFSYENAWYADTVSRIQAMQAAGIQIGYFFCYRDGGFSVPANSFALVQSSGAVRLARYAVLGLALPTGFAGFMAHL